jgi:hypothetical protein
VNTLEERRRACGCDRDARFQPANGTRRC